jgi:hypothetical protein
MERTEETYRQGIGNLNLRAESRIAERGSRQPYLPTDSTIGTVSCSFYWTCETWGIVDGG